MESINIIDDIERSERIYRKYFRFEKKMALKKFPVNFLFGVGIIFCSLGYFFHVHLILIPGVIAIGMMTVFMLYLHIQYQIATNKFIRQLERTMETEFTFSFDNQEIILESKNITYKADWNFIQSYHQNDDDLYLYQKNKVLYNIISESIIGKDMFRKFKAILDQKMSDRKK